MADQNYSADVRNLIVMDAQFGWRGSTEIKAEEMARLEARGWVAEGHENGEYDVTDAGRAVIERALAAQPAPAGEVPMPEPEVMAEHRFHWPEVHKVVGYTADQLRAYGDARAAAAVAKVPDGWVIRRHEHGYVGVRAPDGNNWMTLGASDLALPERLLYALADALLAAAPQPAAVNPPEGKKPFFIAPEDASQRRDHNGRGGDGAKEGYTRRPQPEAKAGADDFEAWLDRDWPLWRNDPANPNVARCRRAWQAAQPKPAEGVAREFTNELGNRIKITIEGPTSISENVLTPIEVDHLRDALNEARTAPAGSGEAVATNIVGWLYEDHLPEGYPYDAMFPHSMVDGVRKFPVYAPAVDAEALAQVIADELARIDGYDPSDQHGGLYELRWIGGTEPEPAGDAWSMDYLPKGERIARRLSGAKDGG